MIAEKMITSAIRSVDPYQLITQQLSVEDGTLSFHDQKINLNQYERIYVAGIGKAAGPMASAIEAILTGYTIEGSIIVKYGHRVKLTKIRQFEAAHPVPDQNSLSGTQEIINLVQNAGKNDLVFFLISGGGSALFELLPENISLKDLIDFNQQMLSCGATIEEINTLRKHISLVKGGRFAKLVYPARLVSFILSDVIGDPLESIVSGPTAPDPSTFADVEKILKKYELHSKLPHSVIDIFKTGSQKNTEDTPKPGDSVFKDVQNIIIGNNQLALKDLEETATEAGFEPHILTDRVQGEAKEVAKFWAAIIEYGILNKQADAKPLCIISGGEPTVTLKGSGLGGRNQELALAVLEQLKHVKRPFYFCSVGSDGTDGPTDAAGAWINQDSYLSSQKAGFFPEKYLANNDSYNFFKQTGGLIKTGPTGTNVMDMMFCLL